MNLNCKQIMTWCLSIGTATAIAGVPIIFAVKSKDPDGLFIGFTDTVKCGISAFTEKKLIKNSEQN